MGGYVGPWDFQEALRQLGCGERVARAGWNGKGMWIVMVPHSDWSTCLDDDLPRDVVHAPFIAMKTADNMFVPWLASQTNLLAKDWDIVDTTY